MKEKSPAANALPGEFNTESAPSGLTAGEITIDSEVIVSYDNAEIDFKTPANEREKP